MERNIIQTHHESLCHVGVDKLYDHLKKIYWFPEMKSKIKNHIQTCLKYIYFSKPSGPKEGVLHNIPKGDKPFDTIHVDHYGPLPSGIKNKKKYVFSIVDGFTKFIKFYPVKSTTTNEVIQCLKTYFEYYNRPNRIVSDRGSCFTALEFSSFCTENKITHIKVATHSLQSNGQVEIFNKVLTPRLAKECEIDPGEWTKFLAKVEFSINNTTNKSTKYTPSTLLFGVPQKGIIDDKVKEFLSNNNSFKESYDMESLRKQAAENIAKNQEIHKTYYDKKHKKPHEYKTGDLVVI